MATKQEITAGIREVEQRLEGLLPTIEANLEKPLLDGSWTVHDALCHIAADAYSMPRWQRQVEAAIKGTSPQPPGFDLDEHNQRGIDERKHKPLNEIIQEIKEGLDKDAAAVADLDEDILAREIPNFRGELQPASERLRFTTSRHNHVHLDDIEKAINAAAAGSDA